MITTPQIPVDPCDLFWEVSYNNINIASGVLVSHMSCSRHGASQLNSGVPTLGILTNLITLDTIFNMAIFVK